MYYKQIDMILLKILPKICNKLFINILYEKYNQQLFQFFKDKNYLQYKNNLNNDDNFYYNDEKNIHHWTTKYVWEYVVPDIMGRLDIDNFNKSSFKKIIYKDQVNDFSFHIPIQETYKYSFINFNTNDNRYGHDTIDVLRLVNQPNLADTKYHSLFRGFHNNCYILNNSINNNNKLLICADSMSIPFIPILAYYFKQIFIIDNRFKKINFLNLIQQFQPNYFISCLLSDNYVNNALLNDLI